jgi:agmatinase
MNDATEGFHVNGPGLPGKLFGLPFTPETARVLLIPVPWEATVSYRAGTAAGPEAILRASQQIDCYHREIPDAWRLGMSMAEIPPDIKGISETVRFHVQRCVEDPEASGQLIEMIDEECANLNIYVRQHASNWLTKGKLVGVVGGDHGTPLGLLQALAEKYDKFGILHIDAHADLRKAYQGFRYSHGSIMYNALKSPAVSKLVQIGIRDLCEAEHETIRRGGGRVRTLFDDDLSRRLRNHENWTSISKEIINELPTNVYISFDIDGLDARYCPNTGTPVPGGLEFDQSLDLIREVARSGRKVIGFDLSEVSPGVGNDWDANVGARLLWNLCCWAGVSNGWLRSE